MKTLYQVFLARGEKRAAELAGKAIRHGVGALGGYLVGSGLATGEQVASLEPLVGALTVLVAVLLSAARTWASKKA